MEPQMKNEKPNAVLSEAIDVLKMEAESILGLADRIDEQFAGMIDLIFKSSGRVIIAGIGKSGIIARKIAATLNSTGTRSLFMHPVEAMHGDLGMVSPSDVFLALSTTGETDELNILLPSIGKIGCPIIAFTGNLQSTLARNSDIVIDVGVEKEACPLGLAPTCSSTAMLAMGDALAVVLSNRKKFKSDDFKRFHPGGALGQRLAGRVNDIMLTGKSIPWVATSATIMDAITTLNHHNLGVILIVDDAQTLKGIITDGDIRRQAASGKPFEATTVDAMMTTAPHFAKIDTPTYDALNTMEKHQITVLPIIDGKRKVKGILHLHDILGKGEFKFNGK
jgi:arabinose-5-phosphate isomerase